MIPQTIHYCWFGKDKYTKTIANCIKSWKKYCPDYKFILWNEENSPMHHHFVKDAFQAKKYAFVADYVRLWAVFNEGGIYLDTDILVLKPFDNLIEDSCFFGYQDEILINAAIFGAEKNNLLIGNCIEAYNKILFNNENLQLISIPEIITPIINTYMINNVCKVYPPEFFYPYPFLSRANGDLNFWKYISYRSYTIHLWEVSWAPEFEKMLGRTEITRWKFWFGVLVKLVKQKLNKVKYVFRTDSFNNHSML